MKVLATLAILSATGVLCAPAAVTNNLVAYWDFEGGTTNNAAATGGSAYNGTLQGNAAVTGGAAKVGTGSLVLDGAGDYLDVTATVDPNQPWSVSAWYRADVAPAGSARFMVFETSGSYPISYGLRDGTAGNTNHQAFVDVNPTADASADFQIADATTATTWHHVLLSFTPATASTTGSILVFIDGTLSSTMTIPAASTLGTANGFHIGTYRSADSRWFDGAIDEVAIWNRTLSQTDAQEVFLRGNQGETLTLVKPFVALSSTPAGRGTVSGSGSYNVGQQVLISATPNPGYVFSGWDGSFAGQPASFTYTANADATATATFGEDTADNDNDGLGVPNVAYPPGDVGKILSMTEIKAISATALLRGYLYVPLAWDGGGRGNGEFAFYDVSNPSNPVKVFHSRDDVARYHALAGIDYVGNFAEQHNISISNDRILVSEVAAGSSGFCVLDSAPLFDNDLATQPGIVSRYVFPGITSPSSYDGFSFSIAWQGSRYVYAPTGDKGLYVVDTGDLANPVLIKQMSGSQLGSNSLRGAWPIGNHLILASAALGSATFNAKIFDISAPANPVQISSFTGPLGYHGFVYGSAFYGAGNPIARHDFTNPSSVVSTTLYSGNPGFDRPEYGYGKDGDIFIGHYPGATKWTLNGNTVTPAGRIDSGLNPVDDHAFLNPLGNLVLMCSDHGNDRNLMIAVHTTEKDTTAPQPLFVSPLNNAVNQHVLSRVGISFSDHVDPKSLSTSTLVLRKVSNGAVVPGSYSAMQTVVNFVPDAPLEPGTFYEAVLIAGGVRDQVGNSVPTTTTLTRFSTGSTLGDYSVAITTTPRQVNSVASLSLNTTNTTGQTLEYSWNFGDGSAATAFATGTTATHSYTAPGNYRVSVNSRIQGQTSQRTFNAVQVVHRPIAAVKPVNQSTIVLDPSRPMIWNVNKDNDSVSGIDTGTHVRTREITVGNKPTSLAVGPNDTLWVVSQEGCTISVINRSTGVVGATYNLPAGSAPHGVVVDSQGTYAYVSLEATGQVAKVRCTDGVIMSLLSVGPTPRGLSLDPSRQKLWVSRFISPDEGGKLTRVDLSSFAVEAVVPLAQVNEPDGLQNGRGIPNYLAAAVLSPDLTQAFVPSKKDNIFRGSRRDGNPLDFDNSVRSMAANLDLATGAEQTSKRLDFDNSDFATAAAFSPLGNMVFFTTSGSATVWAVDAYDPTEASSFTSGGQAPDGVAVNADGSKLYIHNFMDRSVTVFQSNGSSASYETAPQVAKISTVTTESLTAAVLKGKQLFYSSDPRMAREGYMSCASCHLDGGHDGRTWDFSNFGEGLRNTIDLNGRGEGHGPIHWSANFDEVQDFERQIRGFSGGAGLMSDHDFNHGTRKDPLGVQKAGLSADLDALAAYVKSLTTTTRSPHRHPDGSLTASALAGREIFRQENCASCHGGTAFSDSAGAALHDVGTITVDSGTRLGDTLVGLDTPTLRGLWQTAPYLHDGSAATLQDVLVTRNVSRSHGDLSDRGPEEIDQLVAYLESIDDLESSAPTGAGGSAPLVTTPSDRSSPLGQESSLALSGSGTGALSWRAVGLPPGLLLNRVTGVISGVPWQVGVYRVILGVQDPAGRTASTSFTWTISWGQDRRYVKFRSLSSQNGDNFSSMAEFNLLGGDGLALPRTKWGVTTNSQNNTTTEAAANVLDGQNYTYWHSKYTGGTTAFPHDLNFDLGTAEEISGFTYLPRPNSSNEFIKDYQVFRSTNGVDWGTALAAGTFTGSPTLKTVLFDADGDGFLDLAERSLGSDPANASSKPPAIFTGMLGWWRLDEASGNIAEDRLLKRSGTILGSPPRVPGASGGAVELSDVSQSVRIPALGLSSNTLTISCWVRRNGQQNSRAGLVFTRDASINNANGLNFYNATNKLGYYWNSYYTSYDFNSNLLVPDGVWTFCALVVEPTKATLYMQPEGGTLQSAVNTVAHPVVNLAAEWHMGRDTYDQRWFKGRIDECRLHDRALSSAEIATLANRPPFFISDPIVGSHGREGVAYSGTLAGAASDSDPGHSITYTKINGPSWLTVASDGTLSGTPGAGLEGNNFFKVRATDSQGANGEAMLKIDVQPPASGPAGPLDTDGDGFSDSLEVALASNPNSSSSQPSSHFSGIRGWWRLDEGTGMMATDVTGRIEQNGTLLNNPVWTPGVSGSGLALNGTSQSVHVPTLGVTSSTATLSGWIKRQGTQVYQVGIANTAGSVTGLNLRGTTHQLGYKWNATAASYSFVSNLTVPDNVWTFVGMVVEPTKATLYMQPAGGPMQTAVNTVAHAPANFATDFYVGLDPYDSTRLFKGLMDDFRFYARALSTAEMLEVAVPPPAGPAGPLDADGDGFSDSLELALASNPYSSSSRPPPHFSGIRGWWRLDEGTGTMAADATGRAEQNGTLLNNPAWTPGVSGSGLSLNGTTQSVRIPTLGVTSSTATLSGWIKRQGAQVYQVGIANTAGSITGLNLRATTHQLGYKWNATSASYSFVSNLNVPDNVWTFVGMVVEPTKATLYMQPAGGPMQTAVNTVAHAPANFATDFYVGLDPFDSSRLFKGLMDDFRFYGRALSTAEMLEVAVPPPAGAAVSQTSGYGAWAAGFGLNPETDGAPEADKDFDGHGNATEYLLGGSPISESDNPKILSRIEHRNDAGGGDELILTVAVPVVTTAFTTAAPSVGRFENYDIAVEGGTTLAAFPLTVTPVPAVAAPAPFERFGVSYEYRSFSLGKLSTLPGKGFLRVTVTPSAP